MNPSRGIALKVVSTLFFTLMLVCVKAVADRIPPGEIVFFRSFFALVPIVGMLAWQGEFASALRTKRPWIHVSRGTVGVLAMALNFAALAFLPLPEAMMIGYASPLMIVVLAALILHERVRLFRWTAVAVGFVGIVVILWPRFTLLSRGALEDAALLGAVLALVSAFCSAFAAVFVRSLAQTESTGAIVFYFSLIASLMAVAVSLPFGWVAPNATDATLLVLMGLLGGVGQILIATAYRDADAATLASFEYVSMLWGITFGFFLFGDVPTASIILGGAIVIGAGIFIIFRERRLGLERTRQRKAMSPPPG
ncbi:MAG: DMT family transporter [Rhizobiales bacterium]|nr:DMT family transporter [Hyphomicrobiales bacterium]MDQ3557611.1 DMT family transporter [Pseudomonadota bacterium]